MNKSCPCCEWIPVSERLPEIKDSGYSEAMLIYNGRSYSVGWYHRAGFWWTENEAFYVTHWMPLPSIEGLEND